MTKKAHDAIPSISNEPNEGNLNNDGGFAAGGKEEEEEEEEEEAELRFERADYGLRVKWDAKSH